MFYLVNVDSVDGEWRRDTMLFLFFLFSLFLFSFFFIPVVVAVICSRSDSIGFFFFEVKETAFSL